LDVDDLVDSTGVGLLGIGSLPQLEPVSTWAVVDDEIVQQADDDADNGWHDEGDAPCGVERENQSKGVVQRRHDEVRYSSAHVSPTACNSVSCSDHI
jgi:hypothetical protein